jgi:hypothetical protein
MSSPFRPAELRLRCRSPLLSALAAGLPVLLLLLPSGPVAAATTEPRYLVEAGGGVFIPLDGYERDTFGPAGLVNVGFAAGLTNNLWLTLDAGRFQASGEEFVSDDTFDLPESRYSGYPVTLGFRFNTSSSGEERPVRLYLGLGFRTLFTRYEPPFGDEHTASLMGFVTEFRPEIRLGGKTSLYLRQRFVFMGDTDHGNRTRTVEFSGSALDLGLTLALRSGQ